jgi:hypothetical protein
MTSVYQEPTLVLFSIQGDSFLEKFNEGYFDRPFVKLSKFDVKETVLSNITEDKTSGIYRARREDHNEKIIATAGHSNFLLFQEGEFDHPPESPRTCDYCKKLFYGPNFGIPESNAKHRVFHDGRVHTVNVYYVSSFNCCKDHAYGTIDMYTKYWKKRDQYLPLFHQMYSLLYPGEVIRQPNDPELLLSEGGCLDQKQWDDKRYLYTKSKVVQVPIQVEYIRTKSEWILQGKPVSSEESPSTSSAESSSSSSKLSKSSRKTK